MTESTQPGTRPIWRWFAGWLVVALACPSDSAGQSVASVVSPTALQETHPLLPGLRSASLRQTEWRRTLHDDLASGFSPLHCGMSGAPQIASIVPIRGHAMWFQVQHPPHAPPCLLVFDGQLHCLEIDGTERWRTPASGTLLYHGPLTPDEQRDHVNRLLLAAGPKIIVLDDQTGASVWTHRFEPAHAEVRGVVADILPDLPGMELAVLLAHAEEGALYQFAQWPPTQHWQKQVVVPGQHPERHDHGCDVQLDLSQPDQPWLWNIRRFRCHGIDARSGELRSTLAYPLGGEQRRNYGPWALGQGSNGRLQLGVISENVQLHVHGITLHRDQPSVLAWEHFYGEVYKSQFGVALQALHLGDVDGDGDLDMLYTVRDPQHDYRSFVRWRDVTTGEVLWELPDQWGITWLGPTQPLRGSLVITCEDRERRMAKRGTLHVYRLGKSVERVGSVSNAEWLAADPSPTIDRSWPTTGVTAGASAVTTLLLRTVDPSVAQTSNEVSIQRYQISYPNGGGVPTMAWVDRSHLASMCNGTAHRLVEVTADRVRVAFTAPHGDLALATWPDNLEWTQPMAGGPYPTLSAANLDRAGGAELIALTPNDQLQVLGFPQVDQPTLLRQIPHLARWESRSPLIYPLPGANGPALITPVAHEDGRLSVRAVRGDGSLLWQSPPLSLQARDVESFVAEGGRFLPGGEPAIAVSVRDHRITQEGMYLLDGATGQIRWFQGLYQRGAIAMPYRAHGIATAYDVDGDGDDEIGIDMLSYMAYLRGEDGSFAWLKHGPNIAVDQATYAGRLYNTYVPVFAPTPPHARHWFVKGGFGPFGVMHDDTQTGLWRIDLDYDVPSNIGMIDCDADGQLEVGYAPAHQREFVCRDFWTGEVEWTVVLPHPPNAPCLSADVDGDGRGEFLIGSFCLGTNSSGSGEIKWTSPVPLGWSIVADLDGDGLGEIAVPGAGRVTILRGEARP